MAAYEQNYLKHAAGRLASLVRDYPEDRPTIILLSRTLDLPTERTSGPFDPVWKLDGK